MTIPLDHSTFDDSAFQDALPQAYRTALKSFKNATASFVFFNVVFGLVFFAEIAGFLLFLPIYSNAAFVAASLSAIFLTVFTYFVLFFYFQAKKPEQMSFVKEEFLQICRKNAAQQNDVDLSIAAALLKLVSYLDGFELQFYRIPSYLQFLQRPLSSFFGFCHCQDVFRFKQVLVHAAIEEHLGRIRSAPTDLETHASLAESYIALCKLFSDPKDGPLTYTYRRKKEAFEENFRIAAKLAVEEFQILNGLAPNDPWVHERLAQGYCDLEMTEQEIQEVETLLKLRPQDRDLLARIGALYFTHGFNAKGLQAYEELRQDSPEKAEELLAFYGRLKGDGHAFELV